MRYEITIGNNSREVILEALKSATGETYELKSGLATNKIEILKREKNVIYISIGRKAYSVFQVKRSPSSVVFILNGRSVKAEIRSRLENKSSLISSSAASASETVTSNFPAKIVKVNGKVGDYMKRGETIMILEAMKMEAQIKVPNDCVVKEILVKEGQMVEKGKILARLGFG